MDLHRKKFTTDFCGRELSLEFSDIAGQATSSVIGRYGDTAVLVTVVLGDKEKPVDYFPLVVDYEERFYAAGKILGSRFIRREGRPSEEAILSGRVIDRTIRPLFDHRMRREVQVVVTVLSIDNENDPDFVTLISASAALATSKIPWGGPVGGVKLFHNGEKLIMNPTFTDIGITGIPQSGFLGFVAGVQDKINMVELEGVDADEKVVTNAFATAQKEIDILVAWQEKIVKEIGDEKATMHLVDLDASLVALSKKFLAGKLADAVFIKDKQARNMNVAELQSALKAHALAEGIDEALIGQVDKIFDEAINDVVHEKALNEDMRPDGRAMDEVRDLHAEVALFNRAHGSALFVRGDTQALAMTTLGPPGAEQTIETIEFSGTRRFLLHYNFPPYSVGEVGRIGGTGRREVGHGALAEKAMRNVIPAKEVFPYAIRVVSEILSSNGSSSMATVCGASLSLMDAGVPITKPVAGIAMGLMSDNKGKYKILTDIQGPEDHHGDMDFKAAGSADGVRAIQMDVKLEGVTAKILGETLEQAKQARLHILKAMLKALTEPRKELSQYAPAIVTMKIDPSRIGEVIGPGGKVINKIIAETGVLAIDIEQTGEVFISANSRAAADAAQQIVAGIVKEYKVGDIVEGPVIKVLEFGAIVDLGGGKDGMVHVSELKDGFVKQVEDVVKMGDRVKAKVVKVDNGRIGLSIKALQKKA